MSKSPLKAATILTVAWVLSALSENRLAAADSDFFEKKVRPVLAEHCFDCHSADAQESGLRVDSLSGMLIGGERGPAIVPGKPDESLLISAVRHSDTLQMPADRKLPQSIIDDLAQWVRDGAAWPDAEPMNVIPKSAVEERMPTEEEKQFWAFRAPQRASIPLVGNASGWGRTPVDAFILEKLESRQLLPNPVADKRTLIRRATLDLIGFPPTPEEVQAFLADASPSAFETVVERLLSSPHYGERWARHWLDVARYADSNGLDENLAFAHAWRYRDYVIEAFNSDLPYDEFLQEQLAGDLLPASANQDVQLRRIIATGFLSLGAKMLAEDDPIKMEMDIIDEQIDTLGKAVLGMTFGCARCHDHKFDPISAHDYYAFAGIFKSTKTMDNFNVVARWQERPIALPEVVADRDRQKAAADAVQADITQRMQQESDRITSEARLHLAAYMLAAERQLRLDELLKDAIETPAIPLHLPIVANWVKLLQSQKDVANGPFAVWNKLRTDGSPDESLDASPLTHELLADPRPTTLDGLAHRYQQLANGEDSPNVAALKTLLTGSDSPFQLGDKAETVYSEAVVADLKTLRENKAAIETAIPAIPEAMSASEGTPQNLRIHLRGSHTTLGVEVPRRMPHILTTGQETPITGEMSGRLKLAEWLTQPNHPLTARVLVNRVWQAHFGEGLVRSPDNFGSLGEKPSHPELLDWLATEFVNSGWSIKSLHRLILNSAVWQQTTDFNNVADTIDPENRLLGRMNRRRLEAEAIRDSMLAIGGDLDLTMGGTLLPTENRKYVTSTTSINIDVYETPRRTIYLPVVRSALNDYLTAFDFGDPSSMSGQRDRTTVAPQSLFLMNSKLVAAQSKNLATSLLASTAGDHGRIAEAFERFYSRPPAESEVESSLAFIASYEDSLRSRDTAAELLRPMAWQAFCRALMATNEFLYVN